MFSHLALGIDNQYVSVETRSSSKSYLKGSVSVNLMQRFVKYFIHLGSGCQITNSPGIVNKSHTDSQVTCLLDSSDDQQSYLVKDFGLRFLPL